MKLLIQAGSRYIQFWLKYHKDWKSLKKIRTGKGTPSLLNIPKTYKKIIKTNEF